MPDTHHDAAQAFTRRIGHPDVKDLAERLHSDIRGLFGYRRREFEYSCEDGSALIRTPDFLVELRVDQGAEDPKTYCLTTDVGKIQNDAIADDERFHLCFNAHCDRLLIEFRQSVDLESKIDAIEAIPELAPCLDYAPDASEFELKLSDLDLSIHLSESILTFRLLGFNDLGKLLERSRKAFEILTAVGLEPRLTDQR